MSSRTGSIRLATTAAAVLAVGGGSATGWALTHQQHAPQPTAAAAGILPSGPTPKTGTTIATRPGGPAIVGPVLPRSTPVAIAIPAIGVRSSLQDLGLNPNGTIAVPAPGPHYNQAAWFTGSPTPGQAGPAVIEGHVDSAEDGPSVFFRLGALRPGEHVDVTRADHRTAVFTIDAVRRYAKSAFPTATVYGNTDNAALRLITCGGSFDRASGHYRSNIVVFAHLDGVAPAAPA